MVADAVPAFDVKQTCRGTETAGVYPGRNLESCVQSEEATRDQLKKSWGEFLGMPSCFLPRSITTWRSLNTPHLRANENIYFAFRND